MWLHSDDIECLFGADDVVNDFFIFKGKFKYMKRVISARFSHDVIESTAVKRTKPLEGLFFCGQSNSSYLDAVEKSFNREIRSHCDIRDDVSSLGAPCFGLLSLSHLVLLLVHEGA